MAAYPLCMPNRIDTSVGVQEGEATCALSTQWHVTSFPPGPYNSTKDSLSKDRALLSVFLRKFH